MDQRKLSFNLQNLLIFEIYTFEAFLSNDYSNLINFIIYRE